jgi:uncharacterized protein
MNQPILISAMVMGLFGSLHCVGMCGGIMGVLTSSLSTEIQSKRSLFYTYVGLLIAGRLTSYMAAGLLVGIIGEGLFQQLLDPDSVMLLRLVSTLMMVVVGLYIAGWFPGLALIERAGGPFWKMIEPFGRSLLPLSNPYQALGYGFVWGWLPCGMVYTALIMAFTLADPLMSSLVMLFFGVGTTPALFGVALFANRLLSLARRVEVRRWAGGGLIMLALIMLGANQV